MLIIKSKFMNYSKKKDPILKTTVSVSFTDGQGWHGQDSKGRISAAISPTETYAFKPTEILLLSLGSSSSNKLRELLRKKGIKSKITTHVKGNFILNPKPRFDSIDVQFDVHSTELLQKDLDEMVHEVQTRLCPVTQLLRNPNVIKRVD